jgi:hypothetical protein
MSNYVRPLLDKYVINGILGKGEYHPDIHTRGATPHERNITDSYIPHNYLNKTDTLSRTRQFYPPNEITKFGPNKGAGSRRSKSRRVRNGKRVRKSTRGYKR